LGNEAEKNGKQQNKINERTGSASEFYHSANEFIME
jgi:hypothetical protein